MWVLESIKKHSISSIREDGKKMKQWTVQSFSGVALRVLQSWPSQSFLPPPPWATPTGISAFLLHQLSFAQAPPTVSPSPLYCPATLAYSLEALSPLPWPSSPAKPQKSAPSWGSSDPLGICWRCHFQKQCPAQSRCSRNDCPNPRWDTCILQTLGLPSLISSLFTFTSQ